MYVSTTNFHYSLIISKWLNDIRFIWLELKVFSRAKWIAVAAIKDGLIIESVRSDRASLQ
jgi:hypothetical protein